MSGEDTRKIDETLISLVKPKPALYDIRVPAKQRTKIIRENLWKEISKGLKGQLEPAAAEARWKYLRENYIKSCRKAKLREEIEKRTGVKYSKAKGKYSFRYHQLMEFLNDALEYQKTVTLNNVAKRRKRIEHIMESNIKIVKTTSLRRPEPQDSEIKEIYENNVDNDMETEEVFTEVSTNSPNCPLQQNSNIDATDNNHVNQMNSFEEAFLECLKKPIERPCPIDGFLVRLGEGLRRLPYRERSKLELEFLTRLHEVEELLCDDN